MAVDLLRFTTAGSVDDGKSTLIGRLLYDSGKLYEDQIESIQRLSRNGLELAYLTDGLRSEREQGITIDVAYRHFSTAKRRFIIADTPGHEQYTRNMATGASTAELAVILVDARKGILPQTRRHACISHLLGIPRLVLAVNKMDLVDFREDVFGAIEREFRGFAAQLRAAAVDFIPICATEGDNVVARSERMPWHAGPSLLEYLETVPLSEKHSEAPLRLPIQTVIRCGGDFRGYAGQIASGTIRTGDEVVVLPSGKKARISALPWPRGDRPEAFAPQSVTLTLDAHIDVGRGDMLADPANLPVAARQVTARLVWMAEIPFRAGSVYLLRQTTQTVCAEAPQNPTRLDVITLEDLPAEELRLNEIGTVELETHRPIFCDAYSQSRATGSFILIDPTTNLTVGAGMIIAAKEGEDRKRIAGVSRRGLTVWFTGLSSAGKSTLCEGVASRLKSMGARYEVLDGDSIRKHLCKDLGYSKFDRDENIRRIGFVADLLTRNGVVVLAAAISPYRSVREEVRRHIGDFVEVYVNAPLSVCEQRDVKGLYKAARAGKLPAFTGVDDPYEPPEHPEVECRTDHETLEESIEKVLRAIEARVF